MRSMSLTWTLTLLAVRALARIVDLAGPTRLRLRVHVLSARLHRASLDHRSQARRGQPGTVAGVAVAIRQLFHQVSTLFTGH
jgi:hypothetical protein